MTKESYLMSHKRSWRKEFQVNKALYCFVLPAVIEVFIFNYIPIYGILIAFENFRPAGGIWGSEWVGLKWFLRFFTGHQAQNVMINSVVLSFEQILFSFPISILFALLVNQYNNQRFKKLIQTVSYAPHFISTVVMCGMILLFLNPTQGFYGNICRLIGVKAGNPIGDAALFRPIYIISDIWQQMGWESIIYLAALSAIDQSLYDAATVDGANRFQRIRYIEIPHLVSTATLLLILRMGSIMSLGVEKAYLLQNSLNLSKSEIIATYVYKVGLVESAQYSYSAAIGVFNSVVNLILLVTVNAIAHRKGETSLW